MARIVITHTVEDVPTWQRLAIERGAFFSGFAAHVAEHLPTDGSNVVAVTMNVHDLEAFNGFLASGQPPSLLAAHGVVGSLGVWIEEDDTD